MGDEVGQWEGLSHIRQELVQAAVQGFAPPASALTDLETWLDDFSRISPGAISADQLAQTWGNLQLIMTEGGPENAGGVVSEGDHGTAWLRMRRTVEVGFQLLLDRPEWATLRADFRDDVLPRLADAVGQERDGRIIRCIDATDRLRSLAQRTSGIPHAWRLHRVVEMAYVRITSSGWHACMGVDFSWRRAAAVIRALQWWLHEHHWDGLPLVVSYDSRVHARELAEYVTEAAISRGQHVYLTQRDTPTPALIEYVAKNFDVHETAGLVTCSAGSLPVKSYGSVRYLGHPYQGIEYRYADGTGLSPADARAISRRATEFLLEEPSGEPSLHGDVTIINPMEPYCDDVVASMSYAVLTRDGDEVTARDAAVDFWGQRSAMVVIDEMYGAARGYLPRICKRLGIQYEVLHGITDPSFGDLGAGNPEPPFTSDLVARMRELRERYDPLIGFALSTDGARMGVVDETGNFLDQNAVLVLLASYVMQEGFPGQPGAIVRERTVTRMLDRLTNLPEMTDRISTPGETPPAYMRNAAYLSLIGNPGALHGGRTHVVRDMHESLPMPLMLAGDGRGAIHVDGTEMPDGIRAALLLLQLCAVRGADVQALWRQLQQRCGVSFTERVDFQAPSTVRLAFVNSYVDEYAQAAQGSQPPSGLKLDEFPILFAGGERDRFVEWALEDAEGNPAYLSLTDNEVAQHVCITTEASTPEYAHRLIILLCERLEKHISELLRRAETPWHVIDILANVTSPLEIDTELPGTLNCHLVGEAYTRLQELARPGREAPELMHFVIDRLSETHPDKGRVLAACHIGEHKTPSKQPPVPRVQWEGDGEG
ncbi:MAG TPA: hypothetical protein VHV83_01910 [Armatimonadota bacterium]|nr:hypothetical protein [Armatimonadota bacterium]